MENTDVSGVVENTVVSSESVDNGLPKSNEELDRLIAAKKLGERDRIKREMEAKHQAEIEKLKAEYEAKQAKSKPTASPEQESPIGVSQEEMDRRINDRIQEDIERRRAEAEKAEYERQMQNVADTYFEKLKKHGEKNSDFAEMVGEVDHTQFPKLVHAIHGFDNMGEMMEQLINDPRRLEKIVSQLNYTPKAALKALNELSGSLKENEQAVNEYEAIPPPLSEPKPSHIGAGSGMTQLEQLKRKFKW
jgi:hypothetical protein